MWSHLYPERREHESVSVTFCSWHQIPIRSLFPTPLNTPTHLPKGTACSSYSRTLLWFTVFPLGGALWGLESDELKYKLSHLLFSHIHTQHTMVEQGYVNHNESSHLEMWRMADGCQLLTHGSDDIQWAVLVETPVLAVEEVPWLDLRLLNGRNFLVPCSHLDWASRISSSEDHLLPLQFWPAKGRFEVAGSF